MCELSVARIVASSNRTRVKREIPTGRGPTVVTGSYVLCRAVAVSASIYIFSEMTVKIFFQKRSIRLTALASARDWAIFSCVVLGFLGLAYAASVWSYMDKDDLQVT